MTVPYTASDFEAFEALYDDPHDLETLYRDVKAAILALATGRRAVSVLVGGKRIEYAQADLEKLKIFRDEIMADLKRRAGLDSCKSFRVSTSSGF